MLIVTVVGVRAPTVIGLAKAFHAMREAARSTVCPNKILAPGGASTFRTNAVSAANNI